LLSSVSLIDENNGRRVRMGISPLSARTVNGVSALHSELMKQTVFHDLIALYPDRIQQDQRHHLPPLADGGQSGADRPAGRGGRPERLLDDPSRSGLEKLPTTRLQERFERIRAANKVQLANLIERAARHRSIRAMFDVQIKRIHEYKRQLLNAARDGRRSTTPSAPIPNRDFVPRVKIFAGKAAASYHAPS
jgi:starch phosphorylase